MVLYPSADELRQREQQSAASTPISQSQRMAGAPSQGQHQQQQPQSSTPYLSHNQQDLLLAALNAQARARQTKTPQPGHSGHTTTTTSESAAPNSNMSGNALFMSPQDAELDNYDYTPDLDYLDGDNSFDFDHADLGGEMIGALPGDSTGEMHEKRKASEEADGSDESDPKRQETQDGEKGAKKPGRKPLTSEPTTVSIANPSRLSQVYTDISHQKRKAQNRAAQRAFRERKEKHLKDLETKVAELSKSQEADKHENGMLKAQVDRLQVELKEYRKRLSLNNGAGALRGSPPLAPYTGQNRSSSGPSPANSGFQFDFPKFGALPGSQIFGNQQTYANAGNITPPISQSPTTTGNGGLGSLRSQLPAQVQRTNSQSSQSGARSLSPKTGTPKGNGSNAGTPSNLQNSMMFPSVGYSTNSNMHGFASTLPQMGGGDNPFGDLFSPELLKSSSFDGTNNNYFNNGTQQNSFDPSTGGESTAGLNRVFQFNGGSSASDSASPSDGSSSQWNANGANSSCGTSPEPSHDSPGSKAAHNSNGSIDVSYPGSTGDKVNPLRQFTNSSQLFGPQQPATTMGNPNIGLTGNPLDYSSLSNTETFDPVLFGDYRDTTNDGSFGGNADFSTGFFDEALNQAPYDFGSPSNLFGILQSPQQTNSSLNTNTVSNMGAANAPTPSSNLMAQMDKARDGGDDDYGLPAAQSQQKKNAASGKLISCNNIWYVLPTPPGRCHTNTAPRNQLQSNPDFQSGAFDLDSLCSELRAKARCSESGVMVSQDHVDAALKKLGKKDEKSGKFIPATDVPTGVPSLMFEQESWDNVLRKLGGNSAQ